MRDEDLDEVRPQGSKNWESEDVEVEYQQTGTRWPSVAALFIVCATVVALCYITQILPD